jgi:hypothetical protein
MKRLALHFDDTLTQAVCSPYLTKETKKPLLVLLQPTTAFFMSYCLRLTAFHFRIRHKPMGQRLVAAARLT